MEQDNSIEGIEKLSGDFFAEEIFKLFKETLSEFNKDKLILVEKIAEQEIEIASLKNKVKELQSDPGRLC